jgi:hypothetical protein
MRMLKFLGDINLIDFQSSLNIHDAILVFTSWQIL